MSAVGFGVIYVGLRILDKYPPITMSTGRQIQRALKDVTLTSEEKRSLLEALLRTA
jgi:hypothetical protein